jgi:hypothetical protein
MYARTNPFEPADGSNLSSEEKSGASTNYRNSDDGTRTVKIISDEKTKKEQKIQKESKVEKTEKKEAIKDLKVLPLEKKAKVESKTTHELPIKHIEKVTSHEPKEAEAKVSHSVEVAHNTEKKVTAHISKKPAVKKVSHKKVAKKVAHKKVATKTKVKHHPKTIQKHTSNVVHKEPVVSHKSEEVTHKNLETTPIPPVENATRYNILPLLAIDLLDKSLTIQTGGNYKIIKYFEDHASKKFVFDFKAKVLVSNTRENFKSSYFKSYNIGNHNEDGFFRVVIPASEDLSNYKVEIKNNIATITHN